MSIEDRITSQVLNARIDVIGWDEALSRIRNWAERRESRYVCICNVHSVVNVSQDAEFRQVVNEADMATPDGAPVAWMLRRLGFVGQERINGPDLMWKYLEGVTRGESIFLYGSTETTLATLYDRLSIAFPNLKIAGMISPPFRSLSATEDAATVTQINASGAGVVFVGLGCPKQEKWMASHRGRINAVMIGVGAAFDYHAGAVRRAPRWMRQNGLEWLHRLCSEPRRLWKRYLVTNTIFVVLAARQWFFGRPS
jgi:N-acetylglucosaminyldiphosphoundecaprenol N-acetyl-beta-D-mannosaminyltransferase